MKRGQRRSRSHARQRADRLVNLGRPTGQRSTGAQLVRARFAIAEPVLLHVQLHAVAIAERLRRDDRDLRRRLDLPQPPQFLRAGSRAWPPAGIRTARADSGSRRSARIRARRRHALRRGVQHFQQCARAPARAFPARPCARIRSPGSTNGASTTRPSMRRQPIAAVDQLFHRDFEIAYDKSYSRLPYHENTSLLRNAAVRQSAHRKLSGRAEELGPHPARLRVHFLHRRPARRHGLPGSRANCAPRSRRSPRSTWPPASTPRPAPSWCNPRCPRTPNWPGCSPASRRSAGWSA